MTLVNVKKRFNKLLLGILCIPFAITACGGGDTGSSKNYTNNSSETNNEIIIKPEALINKNLFSMVNPGCEYSQIADCVIIRLNDNLLQGSVPKGIPQMFTLDKSRKSIFYSPDSKTINEYSIQSYTKDPVSLAVSKDGFVFVSDRVSMSIIKFVFNGSTLDYITTIYSNIIAADIASLSYSAKRVLKYLQSRINNRETEFL